MEGSGQDDCQALVTQYQALNGNALQRRALNALVKALTHQQIRELRLSLDEVDLHCDIIAKLPLELSQIILQHLPLYQVFQARRVSSKWKQILSSSETVEPLIRDWFPMPVTDKTLHIPDGLSASSILSLKAEHIEAYRTGHAFAYARHEWSCFPDGLGLVTYADGIIAWVDSTDSHLVKSLDLKTGEEWSFLPEARNGVSGIATSSSMVAALCSDRCHVWIFRTGDRYHLRLPSAFQSEIAISGETLAIMENSGWRHARSRVEMFTWTLKDQRISSFFVALSPKKGGLASELKMMLDSKGESLILFEWIDDQHQDSGLTHFHYVRTSLDGDVLTQGVIEAPDTIHYRCHSSHTVPKETDGHAVIWSFVTPQREEDDFSELMLIYYNFREDRLEVRKQVVAGLRMDSELTSNPFYWKDSAYFLQYYDDLPSLQVIDLQDSTCSKAKTEFSFNCQAFDLRLQEESMPDVIPFGDETFLVNVFVQGLCVWCFDANIQIFNEKVAYKEERKINIARRSLLKQTEKNLSSKHSLTRKLE